MKLGLQIALRFLKSNKGQTFLIILGIAIGVSVQIFIGSLIQGLQKGLVQKTIGNTAHINILADNEERTISNYHQIQKLSKSADPRIKAVSASYDSAALLDVNGQTQSLLVRGVFFEQADTIYDITNRLVEGKTPVNPNEIILGIDLKTEYGLNLYDQVNITTANQTGIICKIVGFFDFKVSNLNNSWGFTQLATVQDLNHVTDLVTGIEIQVNEEAIFLTDEIADNIKKVLPLGELKITNWKEQNESLLSGLKGQSISSYMIQVFVMISVVLGIASVLAITVMQKSRQIGILKALGIRNLSSGAVFLFEGLILGVFGALLGILLGLLLSVAFTTFAQNPDGTPVVELYISASFIATSGIIAVLASVLAALIPAVKSFKLNPIDIIRNN